MARYTGPVCRLWRTEQKKLMLKGDRCKSDKCPLNKKRAAPGKDPKSRTGKRSDSAHPNGCIDSARRHCRNHLIPGKYTGQNAHRTSTESIRRQGTVKIDEEPLPSAIYETVKEKIL